MIFHDRDGDCNFQTICSVYGGCFPEDKEVSCYSEY